MRALLHHVPPIPTPTAAQCSTSGLASYREKDGPRGRPAACVVGGGGGVSSCSARCSFPRSTHFLSCACRQRRQRHRISGPGSAHSLP